MGRGGGRPPNSGRSAIPPTAHRRTAQHALCRHLAFRSPPAAGRASRLSPRHHLISRLSRLSPPNAAPHRPTLPNPMRHPIDQIAVSGSGTGSTRSGRGCGRSFCSSRSSSRSTPSRYRPTDRRTDRPTDRPTDAPTDRPMHRPTDTHHTPRTTHHTPHTTHHTPHTTHHKYRRPHPDPHPLPPRRTRTQSCGQPSKTT